MHTILSRMHTSKYALRQYIHMPKTHTHKHTQEHKYTCTHVHTCRHTYTYKDENQVVEFLVKYFLCLFRWGQ